MENKYKVFLDGINTLEHEKIKNECMSLIYAAQKYYSQYEYHQRLTNISKKFPEISIKNKKSTSHKIQISLIMQLYLNYYLNLFHDENNYFDENISHRETYGGRNKYKMIAAYEDELESIEENFNGFGKNSKIPDLLKEQGRINKNSDKEYIELVKKVFCNIDMSCKKASEKYSKKRIAELPSIEALKRNIKILKDFSTDTNVPILSEEISFNEIFSDAYIELLLSYMNTEEGILPLLICPIRGMLSYAEKYEREIDSQTWRWCFNKQFTQTMRELVMENKMLCQNCQKIVNSFQQTERILNILKDAQILCR